MRSKCNPNPEFAHTYAQVSFALAPAKSRVLLAETIRYIVIGVGISYPAANLRSSPSFGYLPIVRRRATAYPSHKGIRFMRNDDIPEPDKILHAAGGV